MSKMNCEYFNDVGYFIDFPREFIYQKKFTDFLIINSKYFLQIRKLGLNIINKFSNYVVLN